MPADATGLTHSIVLAADIVSVNSFTEFSKNGSARICTKRLIAIRQNHVMKGISCNDDS